MNRKTLLTILVLLLITALVAGGVALWTRNRTEKKPEPDTEEQTTEARGENTASAEEEQTAAPISPDVLYDFLEPNESTARDPNPAVRSVIIH